MRAGEGSRLRLRAPDVFRMVDRREEGAYCGRH